MHNLFKAQKKQSTVDVVINSFRTLLMTGQLSPGQKVPSEAEICDGLGVSRGSVREAMKILAALGVVEIKVGDGTYIPREPRPEVMNPLLFSFLLQKPDLHEVAEFRALLELDIIELIIKYKDRNGGERRKLEENLVQQRILSANRAPREDLVENDMEFHRCMGRAACNKMLQRIYDFAFDYLEPSIRDTYLHEGNEEFSYRIHSKLLEAINSNDIDVAREAVRYSIDFWRKRQTQRRFVERSD